MLAGGSGDRRARIRGPRLPEPLTAPEPVIAGLAVPPPISPGAEKLRRLNQAFGIVGDTAGDIGQMAEERAARIERATREREAEAARVKNAYDSAERGRGVLDSRREFPELKAQISAGKIRPAEGQTYQEFIDEWTANRTKGASESYAAAFRESITPSLADAFVDRAEKFAEQTTAETFSAMAVEAASSPSVTRMKMLAEQARTVDPSLTHEQALGRVILPAAQTAAINGDTATYNAAIEAIGKHYPVERAKLAVTYGEAVNRREAETRRSFHQIVDGMLIDGRPFDDIRGEIMGFRGNVDDGAIDDALQKVKSREAESLRGSGREAKRMIRQGLLDSAVSQVAPGLAAGDLGTMVAVNRGIEYETPDGDVIEIKGDEIVEAARQAEWASIEARNRDNPQRALAEKVNWLSHVPTARDRDIQSVWGGVSRRITAETGAQAIPPVAVEAFDLYRATKAMNESVAASHMNAEDLEFLRMTDFLVTQQKLSPAAAMVAAKTAMNKGYTLFAARDRALSALALNDAVRGVIGDEPNAGDAMENIRDRAVAYMVTLGTPENVAIENAVETFKKDWTTVGGFWVNTRGRPAVDAVNNPARGGVGMDALASVIIDDLLTHENDATYGLSRDELTIKPNPAGGWNVVDKVMGAPIAGTPTISDADLLTLNAAYADDLDYDRSVERFQKRLTQRVDRDSSGILSQLLMSAVPEQGRKTRHRTNRPPFTAAEVAASPAGPPDPLTLPPKRKPVSLPPHMERMIRLARERRQKTQPQPTNMPALDFGSPYIP